MTGKKALLLFGAALASLSGMGAKPVPRELFGQNIEHTRSAVSGGLSAQLVRNRKFAGKPSHTGVAQEWTGYGAKGVFAFLDSSFTHHAETKGPRRLNECHSQQVTCLDAQGEAGISQDQIALRAGVGHMFRVVVRALKGGAATFVLRVRQAGKAVAEKMFDERAATDGDWKTLALAFTPEKTGFGTIEIGVRSNATGVVGAVSVMPDDNFHGMRPDVIEKLREIGTSIVRWPGGNFAGDYRWRDGYIANPDERAPLQSYTEIETQPYTCGYDANDLSTDDILALCAKLSAEPFFTLNVAYETPADAVDWLGRTHGQVKRWSLGNEFGYPNAEISLTPKAYAALVRPHAEALLKADPSLRLTASGFYHGNTPWIRDAAVPLNDVAPIISFHTYSSAGTQVFDTPERVRETYAAVEKGVKKTFDYALAFRSRLPSEVRMSFDEWNLWAAWYREDGPLDGLYAAGMLHGFMKNGEKMGLEDACYFQAINENAIRVGPFSSRLTTLGEAFQLMRAHVGGVPVAGDFPDEVFATDAADGTRLVTCLNFRPYDACSYIVRMGTAVKVVGGELLAANGVAPGASFVRKNPVVTLAEGRCTIAVPPASLVAVRLGP